MLMNKYFYYMVTANDGDLFFPRFQLDKLSSKLPCYTGIHFTFFSQKHKSYECFYSIKFQKNE